MMSGAPRHSELSDEGLKALGARNACDREPIHLSGAVQPLGFLLAVDPDSLVIRTASSNVGRLLGCAGEPLGITVGDLLGSEISREVLAMSPTGNPHDGLPLRVQLPDSGARTGGYYHLVAHQRDSVLILEFEECPSAGSAEAGVYLRVRDTMKSLDTVDDVNQVCQVAAQDLRSLTGYDRVMVYRFDPDANGEVVAESRRDDWQPFLGLQYPASDIPRQARALYLRSWIRVIADVDYAAVPLIALPGTIQVDQLDLSMSVLRSVSPIHLQYLRNMGVRATMTISLVVDNQLWGMVACHHGTPKRIDAVQRLACETFGQLVSVRIKAVESSQGHERARDLSRMAAQVISAMAAGENVTAGAAAAAGPLLGMTAADGAVVEFDGVRISVGTVPSPPCLDHVVHRLTEIAGAGPAPLSTDAVAGLVGWPDGIDQRDASVAAGAMLLAFPGRTPGFVLWLRGERARSVRWAGRPEPKPDDAPGMQSDAAPLTPRASFAEWRETVRGHSRPWHASELTAATELAQAMPEVLLHRAQNRLVRLALHDPLTGLPNRAFLEAQLSKVLSPTVLNPENNPGGSPSAAVLFIDIDGFKAVNDTLGHHIGDELLTLAAGRIAAATRTQDTVARLGGDEFVLLVPDVDIVAATSAGQRVLEAFQSSFLIGEHVLRSITASVGVAVVSRGTEPGEAIRLADTAMYHAKRSGRNQVSIYDPVAGPPASPQHLAADQLRDAIDTGQITVHYQPIFDLTRGTPRLDGFEALARWQHPVRGLITPNQFIGLAEDTGLIDRLGESVMLQALSQLHTWSDRHLTMAVNVSVHQFIRPGYAAGVISQLTELGIAHGRLTIEITESQMMTEPDLALAALSELAAAGVQIAIDDFGTGFSSMAYVRNLPAHVLKIDRLFVSGLPHESKDAAVVAATIQLAHSLGMRTVAEGVETKEQLAHLHRSNADLVQGYLLGKPAEAQLAPTAGDPKHPEHAIGPMDIEAGANPMSGAPVA